METPVRHAQRLIAAAAIAVLALVTAALAGCSSNDQSVTRPLVVTSTDVWGSVAKAIVGEFGTVKTLYSSPDGDPHEFNPSASDSASIADADIVLMNGAHYDQYMADATKKSSNADVIDAASLIGIPAGTDEHEHEHEHGDEHDEDHAGHVHHSDAPNEHVFYSLTAVRKAADKLADELAGKAPDHAADYRSHAAEFGKQMDGLQAKVDGIAAKHRGTKVVQTEPLAGYLIEAAGLVDAAPPAFTAAVENGQSPSAADRAGFDDLLTSRTAKAILYNTQNTDSVTASVRTTAEKAGVPIVNLTETLPAGVTSYVDWQGAQIDALAKALDK
ncbi:metal ABC transporter solute-binding protein, Zn/Mn family [Gordonia sp. (in: high G+C Gram-positive bacteria)]|uniref:metal ABC transporter solute-binding protein, Zn/Mn family n=1 Tax=Gordonia sp. (in: high G+C Gram-positive bacteria) TaxID=84139 RepID=UPI0039E5028A